MKFFGVVLGLKNQGFRRGLDESRKDVRKFKQETAGAFGGITGALGKLGASIGVGAFFKGIVDRADEIQDLGERFDVPTEALQRMGNVAEQEGSSLEGVAKAFNKLTISQSQALGGNTQMQSAFEALGVSMDDLKTLSPEKIMEKIGAGSMDAAVLVKVLGKGALELRNTLGQMQDHATDSVISADDVERMAQMKDNATSAWRSFQGIASLIGGPIALGLSKIMVVLQAIRNGFDKGGLFNGKGFAAGFTETMLNDYLPKGGVPKKSPADEAADAEKRAREAREKNAASKKYEADVAANEKREEALAELAVAKQDDQFSKIKKFQGMNSQERAQARRNERREKVDERRSESRFDRDERRRFRKLGATEKQAREMAAGSLKELKDRHDPAKAIERAFQKALAENAKNEEKNLFEPVKAIQTAVENYTAPEME